MAYIINRFDGTQLTIVDDGILDTSTPLGLIGRNYTGYGEVQNENFIFLLENFSNDSPPARALSGQIWHDKSSKALKVYNGTTWLSIGNATVSETEPAHSNGGLWLKVTTNQLFVSNGTVWNLVGPEGVEGFAVTKMTSTSLKEDTTGTIKPVIVSEIDGEVVSIITAESFLISQDTAIPGFSQLYVGLNLRSDSFLTGNVKGNADTATKLKTSVTINEVPFDGSENISVTASTSQLLKPGLYVNGSDFNGSFEQTWDINATPENIVGSIVARDGTGGFTASTVIADVFGNLTGNVTAISGTSRFDRLTAVDITAPTVNGNASSATRLAARRTINTVPFDGTEDITLPVPAETLTGSELAPNVVNSSLTTLGKLESLSVEAPGIVIGDGNNLYIRVEGFTPTLESDVNFMKLKLPGGSTLSSQTTMSFIPSSAGAVDGSNSPAWVPDYQLGTNIDQRPTLGLPSHRWRNVYSKAATLDNLAVSTIAGRTVADQVTISKDLIVNNNVYGKFVGPITGNVTGNVVGNVTGAASLNMLKSGDTMAGNITWNSNNTGLFWTMNTDFASIKYYNTGDGDTNSRLEFNTGDNTNEFFRWTHTVGVNTYESMRLMPNTSGAAVLTVTGDINSSGNITLTNTNATFQGRGSGITDLNAANLSSGTIPSARLTGSYNINITGNAVTATTAATATANLLRSGDTLTGRLGQHTSGFHAASIENISTRTNSGFFDWPNPTTANGWPVNGSWHHLLSSTHVNDANYYAMQFSADFYAQNLYYRSTAGSGSTAWNKILHSNNWNEYAPTKSGGGATGTWPISITGNASTVTAINYSQVVNALGYVPLNQVNLGNQPGGNISGVNGSFSGLLNLSAGSGGGIKFPNDPAGGGGDTASITYEGISSDRTRLRFRVSNDGTGSIDDKAEFITPDNDGLLVNNYVVLNAANYNNYAPTKSGGGATGTWGINISGNAATASSVAWGSITSKPSNFVYNDSGTYGISVTGTANNAVTSTQVTNPGRITAEGNSTAEGNGLRMREVYANGYPTTYGNAITLGGAGGNEMVLGWSGTTGAHADNYVRSRRDTGTTWSPWAKILTDVNFNSHAPTLTGGNASGTWPINITGNAVTVSSITKAQVTTALGYVPVNPSDITNTAGAAGSFSSITATGDITIRKYEPTLYLNHVGDAGVELAIRVNASEGLVIFEPEDANSEWFRIDDNSGTGYLWGDQILDAGNYNSFAPTKTGVGASGTWPINITGNAVTVTSVTYQQVINALGFTPANTADLSRIATSPLQATNATISDTLTVAAGSTKGIRWPNDSYGGSGDTARITLESAGGEATRMRFTMTNDADDYFEFSSTNYNGLKMNGSTVHHDGNFYITYGTTYVNQHSSQVGWLNRDYNFFDVFPPTGYNMNHLAGFIPSIHVIYYAGGVNGDDILWTEYNVLSDRIRVYVANSEQRARPAANWLAFWRR